MNMHESEIYVLQFFLAGETCSRREEYQVSTYDTDTISLRSIFNRG